MKIFVLEDNKNRQKWFSEKFVGHNLIMADNVKEAKKKVRPGDHFEAIFLDHDLGGLIYVDSEKDNTGYQFAKYMVKEGITADSIVIHSLNSIGAMNIKNVFSGRKNVTTVPFNQLKIRLELNNARN